DFERLCVYLCLVLDQDVCRQCGKRSRTVAYSSWHRLCRACNHIRRYSPPPPPLPSPEPEPPPTLFGRDPGDPSHLSLLERIGIVVMRRLGYTQKKIAERIGCKEKTAAKWQK